MFVIFYEDMYYVVGLGNPGENYATTRHNAGWIVLGKAARVWNLSPAMESRTYSGLVSEGNVDSTPICLLYPTTFMNHSGVAVKKLVPHNAYQQLIVVYDDIDLPLGDVRVSFGRGSGGHNGLSSVINSLNSKDFIRLRIGIAPRSFWTGKVVRPRGSKMASYVLNEFTKRELGEIERAADQAIEVLEAIFKHGYEAAMNTYNK